MTEETEKKVIKYHNWGGYRPNTGNRAWGKMKKHVVNLSPTHALKLAVLGNMLFVRYLLELYRTELSKAEISQLSEIMKHRASLGQAKSGITSKVKNAILPVSLHLYDGQWELMKSMGGKEWLVWELDHREFSKEELLEAAKKLNRANLVDYVESLKE